MAVFNNENQTDALPPSVGGTAEEARFEQAGGDHDHREHDQKLRERNAAHGQSIAHGLGMYSCSNSLTA